MRAPVIQNDFHLNKRKKIEFDIPKQFQFIPPDQWLESDALMQHGGSQSAWETLNSFFQERGKHYYYRISSPSASREFCSRLSPYLAWGNLSLREVYQTLLANWHKKGFRRSLVALASRLHWHCHFMQKFESENAIEHRCFNRAYDELLAKESPKNLDKIQAWKSGKTGIPLVDACMRCLQQTGYLNFRMRAMLVSVFTHHLNQDWRHGIHHLAQLF